MPYTALQPTSKPGRPQFRFDLLQNVANCNRFRVTDAGEVPLPFKIGMRLLLDLTGFFAIIALPQSEHFMGLRDDRAGFCLIREFYAGAV